MLESAELHELLVPHSVDLHNLRERGLREIGTPGKAPPEKAASFVTATRTPESLQARTTIYAGKDGTLYRYNRNSGNWSQNSGNGWQTQKPGGTPTPTLQRQQDARKQGTQRTQNFNSMRSSRSFRSAPRMRMGGERRR